LPPSLSFQPSSNSAQKKAGKSKAGNRGKPIPKISCLKRVFCQPVGNHPSLHSKEVFSIFVLVFY
jgi:hypothetical protein